MNENNLKNASQTDWAKVEAMTDESINVSDIPPLDADSFANARLRMPFKKPKAENKREAAICKNTAEN